MATDTETVLAKLPSWGFANTGTRFGPFLQPVAATCVEEQFSHVRQVHQLTGVCPTEVFRDDGVRQYAAIWE